MSWSKKCPNRIHTFRYIAINGNRDSQCKECGLSSADALGQSIKEDVASRGKLGKWEWICFLNLKPLSSHADSCCCSYMLVEFVQELSQDILSHDSLTAEG